MTGAEYDRAASALLGRDVTPSAGWPEDPTLNGFTRNRELVVGAVLASRLEERSRALAAEAVATGFARDLGCELTRPGCARQVAMNLGALAFRRPLTEPELDRYVALLDSGRSDAAPDGGVELLLTALLQSPGMLYVTELGGVPQDGVVELQGAELASALSFATAGLPPDRELLDVAERGELRDGKRREAEALRLLGRSEARDHYHQFVEEWLGISELKNVDKDPALYPTFRALRSAMLAETRAFVDQVLISEGASVQVLLAGGFSVVPRQLAGLYGLDAAPEHERVDLTALGRVGILQQASFLAAHAHETNSGPVLRGVTVLRRLLCRRIPNPVELGIEVVPPPPDPSLTTRERYARHARDAACAGCHDAIDDVGFTFENFDAIGARRQTDTSRAIDTTGSVELQSAPIPLADSVGLARALAEDPELRDCLARQLFRFMTGASSADAEAVFVGESASLPAEQRSSLVGLVLSYVGSPLISWRVAP